MLWARVMRGISSMARKLTPRSASERAASSGGKRLAEPDERLPRPEQRQVGGAGLGVGARRAHLHHHIGRLEHLFAAVGDAHALVGVFGIRESGAQARSGFHQELGASLIENGECARDHGHPALARRYFGNYADSHFKYGSP